MQQNRIHGYINYGLHGTYLGSYSIGTQDCMYIHAMLAVQYGIAILSRDIVTYNCCVFLIIDMPKS